LTTPTHSPTHPTLFEIVVGVVRHSAGRETMSELA